MDTVAPGHAADSGYEDFQDALFRISLALPSSTALLGVAAVRLSRHLREPAPSA